MNEDTNEITPTNDEVPSRASHWLKGPSIIVALALLILSLYLIVDSCMGPPKELTKEIANTVGWSREKVDQVFRGLKELGIKVSKVIDKASHHDNHVVSVVLEREKEVAKLVTVERSFKFEYKYETTWLGSTKTLKLEAAYRAHGGIDLNGHDPIQIIFSGQNGGSITAEGLHGTLIACEMVEGSFRVVEDNDGWWNKLKPKDRTTAMNQMNEEARKEVMKQGLKHQAEESFLKYLREKAGLPEKPVKDSPFRYITPHTTRGPESIESH